VCGTAKKPTTARTTHATTPVLTHSQAKPATSWLTITAAIRKHTAATRNRAARALVLAFLVVSAADGFCVGDDPTNG